MSDETAAPPACPHCRQAHRGECWLPRRLTYAEDGALLASEVYGGPTPPTEEASP